MDKKKKVFLITTLLNIISIVCCVFCIITKEQNPIVWLIIFIITIITNAIDLFVNDKNEE